MRIMREIHIFHVQTQREHECYHQIGYHLEQPLLSKKLLQLHARGSKVQGYISFYDISTCDDKS